MTAGIRYVLAVEHHNLGLEPQPFDLPKAVFLLKTYTSAPQSTRKSDQLPASYRPHREHREKPSILGKNHCRGPDQPLRTVSMHVSKAYQQCYALSHSNLPVATRHSHYNVRDL